MDIVFSGNKFCFEGLKGGFATGASAACTAVSKVGPIALQCLQVYALYSMYESALSDILCLKTFRHGTNPYAHARIAWSGIDPRRSGIEGEAGYWETLYGTPSPWSKRDQEDQRFFVAENVCEDQKGFIEKYISPKLTAKRYAAKSTLRFITSFLPLPRTWKGAIIKEIQKSKEYDTMVFFMPTVKFHINPDRIDNYQDRMDQIDRIEFNPDSDSAGIGAMSTTNFSVLDIGVLGILRNGINFSMFERMNKNRTQILFGIAKLTAAVAYTAFFFPALIPGSQVLVTAVASVQALEQYGEIGKLAIAILLPPLVYLGIEL